MNERQVKMAWIAQIWQVINRHSGAVVEVEAIGPRDALMATAGWQRVWVEKEGAVEYLVCTDWKVEKREIINGRVEWEKRR